MGVKTANQQQDQLYAVCSVAWCERLGCFFEHLMKLKTKKVSMAEFNEELNENIQGKKIILFGCKKNNCLKMINYINMLHTEV